MTSDASPSPLEAATGHYKARSAAFYRLVVEGWPDDDVCDCGACKSATVQLAEDAHRLLGRAMEAEVFDEPPKDD